MVSVASSDRTIGDPTATGGPPQPLEYGLASAVIGVDSARRLVAFSQQAEVLLQRRRSEVIGQTIDSLPDALREVIVKTLSTGRAIEGQQMLLPRADDTRVTVQVFAFASQGADGAVTGAIVVLNDLTAPRRLDENLRRLDRLASIGTLSASMAHEVKNAMVPVKTFVDLLIEKNQDSELAGMVVGQMQRINSIISQMLRFSGPARPTLDIVHLHEILEHSLCLVQHHLEGRRIKLVRAFHASPDTLHGDAYQLEQAFLNLLFNALDAMGASGELTVATDLLAAGSPESPHDVLLRLTVQDTGLGVAPENLERLFEPFFTTKSEGTGLGLPITQRIIQEHRGTITATSKLNHGTTFTLLLPSAARQP